MDEQKRDNTCRSDYVMTWRNKFLTVDATSLDDMISTLDGAVEELKQMKAAGVYLVNDGSVGDDYATLTTNDKEVAARFGMELDDYDEEEDDDFEETEEEEETEEI